MDHLTNTFLSKKASFTQLLIVTAASLFLTACSSSAPPKEKTEQAFCYKGGQSNDYSCDVEAPVAQADTRPTEIDEDWMYETLGELKKWLKEEKEILQSSPKK